MLTYQDIYTGKTFKVVNNKVTDQHGNIATIPATEWVKMQGAAIICLDNEVVNNCSYSFINSKGNRVNVMAKDRHDSHKTICKAFGLKITKQGNMQSKIVKLGCYVKPEQFSLYNFN